MKVFVTNVSYYKEEGEQQDINVKRIFIRNDLDGSAKEISKSELKYELAGTVVLFAEKAEDVLEVLLREVSDNIVEVEIVTEIDIHEFETDDVGMQSIESPNIPIGKIIFQMGI